MIIFYIGIEEVIKILPVNGMMDKYTIIPISSIFVSKNTSFDISHDLNPSEVLLYILRCDVYSRIQEEFHLYYFSCQ